MCHDRCVTTIYTLHESNIKKNTNNVTKPGR